MDSLPKDELKPEVETEPEAENEMDVSSSEENQTPDPCEFNNFSIKLFTNL